MHIAVLGAGVIGVTTAWELLRDGHEVTLVDRRAEPAAEASLGNAGMIAPGHAYAWSSPTALRTLLKALWRDDLALRFRFQTDPRFWTWGVRFALQCTAARAAANTARKVAFASTAKRGCTRSWRRPASSMAARRGGGIYLFREPWRLTQAAENARILRDQGVEVRVVSPDEAAALDPVYEPVRDRFAGALFAPGDESGEAASVHPGPGPALCHAGCEPAAGRGDHRARDGERHLAPCGHRAWGDCGRRLCAGAGARARSSGARSASICRSTRSRAIR